MGVKDYLRFGSWVIILLSVLTGCQSLSGPRPDGTLVAPTLRHTTEALPPLGALTPSPGATEPPSPYSIYFTDPTSGASSGGPDEPLAKAIQEARRSVDLATYNLTLPSLQIALLDAQARGVRVRVVTESDNLDSLVIEALDQAGIPILGDRREALMHNKFAVIDEQEVWTGSLNFTTTGAYTDYNNLVRLRSDQIAQDFAIEFEEMFSHDLFGPQSPQNTTFPEVLLDGVRVEVFFAPEDGVEERLVQFVKQAQESVIFLAYSFTSDPLANAMIERFDAGLVVSGVMDAGQYESNQGTEYDRLRAAGVEVRLDSLPGLMHHKVLVVDGRAVAFGSYNFSANANERNDENLLIVHDETFAAEFFEEFAWIYKDAQ